MNFEKTKIKGKCYYTFLMLKEPRKSFLIGNHLKGKIRNTFTQSR